MKDVIWNNYFDEERSIADLLGASFICCSPDPLFITHSEEIERISVARERRGEADNSFCLSFIPFLSIVLGPCGRSRRDGTSASLAVVGKGVCRLLTPLWLRNM